MEKDIRTYKWTATHETELDFASILHGIIDYGLDIDYSIRYEIHKKMLHQYTKQAEMIETIGAEIHEDVVKELTKRGYKVYNNKIVR